MSLLKGRIGEEHACIFLQKSAYCILERNYRVRYGEIDIIAHDSKTNEIVFIEVKSRSSFRFGYPEEWVNQQKQKRIYRAARYYISKYQKENQCFRFDVIALLVQNSAIKDVLHIKNVIFS